MFRGFRRSIWIKSSCAVAFCFLPASASKTTQPLHFFIEEDLVSDAPVQQWNGDILQVARRAETVLCREMNAANKRKGPSCDLDFGSIKVTIFDQVDEDEIRRHARPGSPPGRLEEAQVEYLLQKSETPEHRVYVVRELRYCAGHVSTKTTHIAGCTASPSHNTIIALGGIQDALSQVDVNATTVLHELGHQVDLYDREEPNHLMYRGTPVPPVGTKIDPGESQYLLLRLPPPPPI